MKKKELTLKQRVENAKHYDVDFKVGLNDEQVNERIESKLVNKTKKTVTKSFLRIIYDNVCTVLNLILIIMAAVMLYFKARATNFFFVIVLVTNIGISLFQDFKARKLVSKLSLLSNPKANVIRNGQEKLIPFDEIVLGDIIIIKQGNTIPTDGILVDGSIKVNESFLTGEMNAIKKNVNDSIYGESYVLAGTAKYRVTKIGDLNYASTIQEKAKEFSRPKSEILASLTKLIRGISIIAIVFGIAQIITIVVATGEFASDKAISFASSVVAMIPNGMYLMTSIALTVGVIVLSHNKILVRELYSIEMLARVNVLCVDKTGTVTDGKMVVQQLIPLSNKSEEYIKECISDLLFITKDDNLTAHALKKFVPYTEFSGPFYALPFESEKKYSGASYDNKTIIMGAAGFFNVTNKKDIESKVHELEEAGNRVMLIAESNKMMVDDRLPNNLKAIGIIVISEHIKDDAKQNIQWFKDNDVNVKMISGDSPKSLKLIAKEVGIDDGSKICSLEGMSEEEVRKAATKYNVFGRVLPEQKRILVDELRNSGNTVAMVGDGVNDLLALKQADCSIAMANGSDAVKAASHLVSLDSNFSSLPKVVEEGRKVINNLQRVCSLFLVKTSFAITVTFIFLIFGWIDKEISYPFTPNNLIMWETLTIGLAPLLLALEPNKNKINKGFLRHIFKNVIPAGVTQVCVCITMLAIGYFSNSSTGYKNMAVILITMISLITLYNISYPFNKYRAFVAGGVSTLMLLCFIADFFYYRFALTRGREFGFFGIDYYSINGQVLITGLAVLMLFVPLYLFLSNFIKNERRKKHKL